ncbi:tetratricopeptide repeat protein [bacterium]|nr:tetratricopeptide repeat protein [bacterium]
MKKQQRWISRPLFIGLTFSLLLNACVGKKQQEDFSQAQKLLKLERYEEALPLYEKVFLRSPNEEQVFESAKIIAELSEVKFKNYTKAIHYLEFVIANAKKFEESYQALYKKAFIEHKLVYYFEDAIRSYQRLLSYSDLPLEESAEIRLNIAKCLNAIHNYSAARTELVALISPTQKKEIRYKAKLLEASIFQTEGKLDDAIKSYTQALIIDVDEKEKKEGLISLALCYEQKEAYKSALETVKKISKPDEFLKIKVSQLERLVQFQGRRLQR